MIWFVAVDLKQIFTQERNYPWLRPDRCLHCQGVRVWSHGYCHRFFDGFSRALLMKCYRCPDCRCVMTVRPDSHFSRIRAACQTIKSHLEHRINHGFWPASALRRSRCRYWLANLKRQVHAHLTYQWSGLIAGFDQLYQQGIIPVARVS